MPSTARLPDYAEALAAALREFSPLGRTEKIALSSAAGRVLAEEVRADRDLPPFDRAQLDGYALRASEFTSHDQWPVAATISAGGDAAQVSVPPGHCVAIATGAPLPPDVDTVIPLEVSDRGDLNGRPVRFTLPSIRAGRGVHPRGADARCGDLVIPARTLCGAQHVGIAAAVGAVKLGVFQQPRAFIVTSGDEVVGLEDTPLPHQIRNSNAPMLAVLLSRMGAAVAGTQHVPDEPEPTIAALGEALQRADIVITVGGISAGDRDHFPAAFDEHRISRQLQGASIQPGRPIYVGRSPAGPAVIGLPGNPVSALACACLFAWPMVRLMSGLDPSLPWREVTLTEPVRPNAGRRAFRPALLADEGHVVVPRWAGSGDLVHTAPTAGLAELPVQADDVPLGARLRFLAWP